MVELAEELWDLLTQEQEPSLGSSVDMPARYDAINAVEARWKAIGGAISGRHKAAAQDRYLRPPVTG